MMLYVRTKYNLFVTLRFSLRISIDFENR